MGITIRGKFEGSPEYDMGYTMFYRLRRDIAYHVSQELGHLYDTDYGDNEKLDRIVRKHRLPYRFLDFLYAPECRAQISPMKCKAVLDMIKDMPSRAEYGYMGRARDDRLTIDKFKELLKECVQRKCYLEWW